MLEILLFIVMAGMLLGLFFWPLSHLQAVVEPTTPEVGSEEVVIDGASVNVFLLQMRQEIETTLCPRPTDSVLVRHYDGLVAAQLAERLAAMPN